MLKHRKLLGAFLILSLLVLVAILWTGPYCNYYYGDHTKNEYCAAYEGVRLIGAIIQRYSGAITAIATFAIALFTWTLWRSSEKMWIATQKALRHAEETAERQLRAYVHISRAAIKFEPPEIPEWHLEIKNFGQTPAYNVRQWTHIWITERPLKEVLPTPGSDFQMSSSVLPPGNHEIMIWKKDPPIPAASLSLIGTAVGTVYIYGEIKYTDAFKKQRFTRYRLFYGDGIKAGTCMLMPDSEGNEAT
jgi:hypothetical protein